MKLNEAFEKIKDTEEGKSIIGYVEQLQEQLKQAREDEEAVALKAQEQIDKLEEELYLAEEKLGEVFAGFFLHIRARIVEPKGLELGKTSKEITKMTLETLDLYLKEKVDFNEVERLLNEADEDETEGDHVPKAE